MRLLFVSALYAPEAMGGAEITLARLADGLQTRGHDVAVLTTGRVSADAVLATGVRVLRRRIANIFPLYPDRSHALPARIIWQLIDAFNPLAAAQVAAAIGDVRPDVVVTDSLRGFSVSAWSAAARAGVPIVHRICDSYLLSPSLNLLFAPPISAASAFRRMVRWPARIASRRVTSIVSLSRAVLDLHIRAGLLIDTPATIIPTAQEAIPEFPRRTGRLRLGFLGQLIPTKGVETLIEGFLRADPDATLDIGGSGEPRYVAQLKQRYNDPRLRFLGWVTDKPRYFAQIDLCVVPSRIFDTLPTVILEAFAHHVPVLAAPIGGIPEMIVPGRNGALAPMETPERMADAVRAMLADPGRIRAMAETTAAASRRFLDPQAQLNQWESALARAADNLRRTGDQ